jgi:uncharacterized metal-binding protein
MPSGRTHDRITLISLPLLVGGSLLINRNAEYTLIAAGAFLFSGMMFGPDLDIYSVQYQRWGILRWLWLPYRKLLSHRSFFSHGFIVGTLIRVFYLSIFLIVVAIVLVALAQAIWGFPWNWRDFSLNAWKMLQKERLEWMIAFFIGLELGAMSHYLSDWLNSAYKRSYGTKKTQRKIYRKIQKPQQSSALTVRHSNKSRNK